MLNSNRSGLLLIILISLIMTLSGCKKHSSTSTTTLEEGEQPLTIPQGEKVYINSGKVMYVRMIGPITGENSINTTFTRFGFGRDIPSNTDGNPFSGTDLGIPVYDAKNDRMLIFFGDSFDGYGKWWLSNMVAFSTDFKLDDGLYIDSFLMERYNFRPKAVIQGKHDPDIPDGEQGRTATDGREVTKIPTGGIAIGDNIYMHYMSIRYWRDWRVNYNGVVKSTDGGQTWVDLPHLRWTEAEAPNFGQVFPIEDKENPDMVYIYGIPGGRNGGVKLGRVLKENYENLEEYEYFAGFAENNEPIWVKGKAGLAHIKDRDEAKIIKGPTGELSVVYNPFLQSWMISYLRTDRIVFRTAPNHWGPWSKEEIIVWGHQFHMIYGAFMHEKYTTHNGQRVYFIMSQYNPLYDAYLMEMVLNPPKKKEE